MPSEAISDVKLAQRACSRAGLEPISAFSDGTAEAIVLNDNYDGVVDDALASFPWPFATSQEVLNRLVEDPPSGWDGIYQVPTKALHVRRVLINDEDTKWQFLGGKIAAMAGETDEVRCEFTERVAEAAFHPVFAEYVVLRLASILSTGVAHDANRAALFEQKADRYYRRARFVCASERTPRRLVASRLTAYR